MEIKETNIVTNTIDRTLVDDNQVQKKAHERKVGQFFASEVGKCVRKIYFDYMHPKDMDPEVLRLLNVGEAVHELVAKLLVKSGKYDRVISERSLGLMDFASGVMVRGRLDNLLVLKQKDTEENILIEVKSIKDFYYLKGGPNDEHVVQTQLYMHVLGLKKAILFYWNMTTRKEFKEFEITYDPELIRKEFGRLISLTETMKRNRIPIAEAKKNEGTKGKCRYCPYRQECEAIGDDETNAI
jgi:CRISPR/Cas system-associated exonuclease Cas4 (RecB family)